MALARHAPRCMINYTPLLLRARNAPARYAQEVLRTLRAHPLVRCGAQLVGRVRADAHPSVQGPGRRPGTCRRGPRSPARYVPACPCLCVSLPPLPLSLRCRVSLKLCCGPRLPLGGGGIRSTWLPRKTHGFHSLPGSITKMVKSRRPPGAPSSRAPAPGADGLVPRVKALGGPPASARWSGLWSRRGPTPGAAAVASTSSSGLIVPLVVVPPAGCSRTTSRSRSASPAGWAGPSSSCGSAPASSARAPSRSDLPSVSSGSARGSMAAARAIASDPVALSRATSELRLAFFANSSRLAACRKRQEVEELATLACRSSSIYPLSVDTVHAVAASLKGGGFKSGHQYLGELRLGHVEAQFPVSEWLARAFALCKRALLRGTGPTSKAAVLRLGDLVPLAPSTVSERSGDSGAVADPWRSYVVAHWWLLREIELANCKLAHASTTSQHGRLTGTIWLPVSKTDIRGAGTSVCLACDCRSPCDASVCPAHCLEAQIAAISDRWGASGADGDPFDIPLFPSVGGDVPAKAKVIEAWNSLAPINHARVGGHSARRSGAQHMTRRGWTRDLVMRIGRWASSAVAGYIEEACADLPIAPALRPAFSEDSALPALGKRLEAMDVAIAALRDSLSAFEAKHLDSCVHTAVVQPAPDHGDCGPRCVLGLASRRLHRVASCSIWTPHHAWQTACGWRFAGTKGGYSVLAEADLNSLAGCSRTTLCTSCKLPPNLLSAAAVPSGSG